jgi:hypothetical protein
MKCLVTVNYTIGMAVTFLKNESEWVPLSTKPLDQRDELVLDSLDTLKTMIIDYRLILQR